MFSLGILAQLLDDLLKFKTSEKNDLSDLVGLFPTQASFGFTDNNPKKRANMQ